MTSWLPVNVNCLNETNRNKQPDPKIGNYLVDVLTTEPFLQLFEWLIIKTNSDILAETSPCWWVKEDIKRKPENRNQGTFTQDPVRGRKWRNQVIAEVVWYVCVVDVRTLCLINKATEMAWMSAYLIRKCSYRSHAISFNSNSILITI